MAVGEQRANVDLVAAVVRWSNAIARCWLRRNRLWQPRLQMLRLGSALSGEVFWRQELCLHV